MYDDSVRSIPERGGQAEALGQADSFLEFQESLARVARVDRPVLILGERGTGKELAAQRIHFLSQRWEEPLVALNCAALAPSLIESELFGHEAGAFTGAAVRRTGRFEAADGGTLFLDELGNIPMQAQEKILRAVEYGVFERVGGSESVQVDVRIVGATNADLPAMAAEGKFKADLLDRLSFEVLYAPPMRERVEDIMLLANHFAARMAMELGRDEPPEFSDAVIDELEAYPWYGNVRELKNVIERAVYQAEGERIISVEFDPFQSRFRDHLAATHRPLAKPEGEKIVAPTAAPATHAPEGDLLARPFKESVEAYELRLIRAALQRAQFNQRKAADLLDLTYHQFRGLYRKHAESLD